MSSVRSGWRRLACVLALGLVACADRRKTTETLPPPIPLAESGAVVARVGDTPITAPAVVAIAKARHVSLQEARDLAIRDALFANEALSRRMDVGRRRDIDAAIARGLSRQILAEAKAAGPVTQAEVDSFTVNHFYDVQRPEGWVTVHAIVVVPPDADDALNQRAKKVAEAIRVLTKPVADAARGTIASAKDPFVGKFYDAASTVDAQGLEVKIEPLPSVAADGGTLEPTGRSPFDPAYVKAAVALGARGDLSEPVRSSFGWHVILLLDRVPPRILDYETRKELFMDDVYDRRAQKNVEALLAGLRTATPSEIGANVAAILAQIHIGDDPSQAAQVGP